MSNQVNNYLELKKRVTKIVIDTRSLTIKNLMDGPRFIVYDTIVGSDGSIASRKKVILMTPGCSIPTCTMCPFTNENRYGLQGSANIPLEQQVHDVLAVRDDEPPYEVLALYNDGSFFAPREVPDDVQLHIGRLVSQSRVRELVVESLPQFITRNRMEKFVASLGEVHLQVGIGLQSATPFVREVCVNTSFSNQCFEQAIEILASLKVTPKIYIMIKPPFLTEEEGVIDTLHSIEYVLRLGIRDITLCPTRISQNTLAWELYKAELYSPPNLWSIIDIIQNAPRNVRLRVACINLKKDDFDAVVPDSCANCREALTKALENYSLYGKLDVQRCHCHPYQTVIAKPLPNLDMLTIVNRVNRYTSAIENSHRALFC